MVKFSRRPVRRASVLGFAISVVAAVLAPQAAHAAFPSTPYPRIVLERTLTTTPFPGAGVSMRDDEGSAYVPTDGSLWLADDDSKKIFEVDPVTGALKRTIGDAVFAATPQYGGGALAGSSRDRDLESISYDAAHDALYVFSGSCCTSSVLPTVFRLTRDSVGTFQVDSYQPLATGSDFTGSAWNPGDGQLYIGVGSDLRTYDYATNTAGATFQIPKLTRITGLAFSPDGRDLYVAHKLTMVSRIDWSAKKMVSGWSFDLSSFGILDARAIEIVGDQLYVSDGNDFRSDGDPLAHAVFVFNLTMPPPDLNIIGNGGFEQGTAGWNANGTTGVTLAQAAGGHSGSYAARLTNTTSTATTVTLNDSPNWVDTTYSGTYTARAWVRSDTGTGSVILRIREYQGSTLVGETSQTVTLSSAWQQLSISLVPNAAGSSSLDVNVWAYKAAAGSNLYVDDVVLNFG